MSTLKKYVFSEVNQLRKSTPAQIYIYSFSKVDFSLGTSLNKFNLYNLTAIYFLKGKVDFASPKRIY